MMNRVDGRWTVMADGSVPHRPWYAFRWGDTVDRDGKDFRTWRLAFNYAQQMAERDRRHGQASLLGLCGPDCNQSHWRLVE